MSDSMPVGQAVTMDAADYYKLRTRIADADAAVVRAAALLKAKDTLLLELAQKYAFDPAFTRWQCNDDTCEFSFS